MNMYHKVFRGRFCLRKLPEMTAALGITRPLVVGHASLVSVLLRQCPSLLSSPVFSAFHSNPDLSDSEKGAEMYRKECCDGLISIGGGSCIDTAKAVKARLNTETEDTLTRGLLNGSFACPHIAIPGTAGTGSEATQFAVVYVNGVKVSLNHPMLKPDGVILDASLLDSLPLYHRQSGLQDTLLNYRFNEGSFLFCYHTGTGREMNDLQ